MQNWQFAEAMRQAQAAQAAFWAGRGSQGVNFANFAGSTPIGCPYKHQTSGPIIDLVEIDGVWQMPEDK